MASAKSHRYGQGGSGHRQDRNPARRNGKSWKQYPKAFDLGTRKLITVTRSAAGETHRFV